MNAQQWIDALNGGSMAQALEILYRDRTKAVSRLVYLLQKHSEKCPNEEVRIFSAPGRTEICGNHTDHNHGKVIAASIDLDIVACVSQRTDKKVNIFSDGIAMDLSSLEFNPDETHSSESLIRGIAYYLFGKNKNFSGFDCTLNSRVPMGSGLSSSAAFEVLMTRILSALFLENKTGRIEIAKISQRAENEYFRKPCGLMDQMASSWGEAVMIDFADPIHPIITGCPMDFDSAGYTPMVINSGGSHEELTPHYAAARSGMINVAKKLGKETLGSIKSETFFASLPLLKASVNHTEIMRAIHFYAENLRVEKIAAAAAINDIGVILRLLSESGHSSFEFLQNVMIPKSKTQDLALSLGLAQSLLDSEGAVRVHGGGFAGTILAFVPHEKLSVFTMQMEKLFGTGSAVLLKIRPAGSVEFGVDGTLITAP